MVQLCGCHQTDLLLKIVEGGSRSSSTPTTRRCAVVGRPPVWGMRFNDDDSLLSLNVVQEDAASCWWPPQRL